MEIKPVSFKCNWNIELLGDCFSLYRQKRYFLRYLSYIQGYAIWHRAPLPSLTSPVWTQDLMKAEEFLIPRGLIPLIFYNENQITT